MRIKKSLMALAVLGAVSAQAHAANDAGMAGLTYSTANTNVTLYALIDATLSNINHANAKGDSLTDYQVAWFSGNRWGITGKREFGADKLGVIFRLESEYTTRTGAEDTPGVLFNRDAWIGFESDTIGKLTFGRQNSIARDPIGSAIYGDPYGSASLSTEEGGYTNTNNFKQIIYYAGSANGTRINDGLVWKKVFSNGLAAGLQYSFGGVPGDFSASSTETGVLGYNGSNFHLSSFFTHAKINGAEHKSYSAGGNVQISPLLRLNAGYFHYTADQPLAKANRSENAYTVSFKLTPQGPMDYELGYQVMKATNAAVNGSGNVINAFADGSTATAVATGDRSTVYASVFYHLDKYTELYVAADYLKLTDGYHVAATNGYNNQTELAVGVRAKF